MRIGLVSRTIGNPETTLDDFVAEACAAERDGFAFLSVPNIFGLDALTALCVAGRETERIELATGVIPTPPRHPVALAQQALTAQAACRGRFVLGIGLSHKLVIEDMLGLSYRRPARQMEEYLEVLMPLVQGQPASFEGEIYRVKAGLQVAGGVPVPVLVAALGPRMLGIAGRLADGTATWMTGPRTLSGHTIPTLREAAKAAGRPEPRVSAGFPIAITSNPAQAREVAGKIFALYGTLPSYRAMLDREGVAGPGDIALVGSEGEVRSSLRRLSDTGVTELAASLFPADDGALERTREFLRSEL
ncbi:MAG: TIGR03564 family F420-dependent LLM class oxidoreductase [Myxococcota bacterium]